MTADQFEREIRHNDNFGNYEDEEPETFEAPADREENPQPEQRKRDGGYRKKGKRRG
jgi:hypothetical protein